MIRTGEADFFLKKEEHLTKDSNSFLSGQLNCTSCMLITVMLKIWQLYKNLKLVRAGLKYPIAMAQS